MATSYTFKRVEQKYLIDQAQYQALKKAMEKYMERDVYGEYTICNLYYDTEDYELVRQSLDKPVYKEKLRLRSYGTPNADTRVYLELKKKYEGIVYKRRVSLTLKEAENYLKNGQLPFKDSQILNEIDYFIKFYHPKERVYIAYDREAFAGKEDPEFRITFDSKIRSRFENLKLEDGDCGSAPLNTDYFLMEVKVTTALPLWLVETMSELQIYPCSFSKYGQIYTDNMEQLMRAVR